MPSKNDTILGGHCLLCVGYNDKTEQFIFKNSWGTGWGASGYGFLPYAYMTNVNLTSDVWYIKTAHSL
jgi:C1A family cysteine protease